MTAMEMIWKKKQTIYLKFKKLFQNFVSKRKHELRTDSMLATLQSRSLEYSQKWKFLECGHHHLRIAFLWYSYWILVSNI